MPPKGSTKSQAKTPQTKGNVKAASTPTTSKTTTKKAAPPKEEAKTVTPKKTKAAVAYTRLARNDKAVLPVDVSYPGDIAQAKQVKTNYTHSLKLDASAPFVLVDSYLIPEGQQHEGHQVVLLKPAPAFKFMKLPNEVRNRIYGFLFFTKGQGSQPIALDGKRKDESKTLYAKSFAENSKYRVAILAVNKEINKEATPVLYGRPLRFDSPATLLTFLANLDSHHRTYLRHVELHQYVKKDAKTALTFLAEAKGLERLRIEVGIATEDNVDKAASAFWSESCKLLEVVGSRIEKTMVPPRKAKLQDVEEESSEEESDDDDDEEESESEDDEEAEAETGKIKAPAQFNQADAKDTKDDAADSSGQEDTIQVKSEVANTGKDQQVDTTAEAAEESIITNGMDKASETDEIMLSCETEKTADTTKKDSKSPIPPAPTKKTQTKPEPPKLIQGKKSFAVDILDLGRFALKTKGGASWSVAQKQKFLQLLEQKLK